MPSLTVSPTTVETRGDIRISWNNFWHTTDYWIYIDVLSGPPEYSDSYPTTRYRIGNTPNGFLDTKVTYLPGTYTWQARQSLPDRGFTLKSNIVTINVITPLPIYTALTIAISPTPPVAPSTPLTFTGKLTRLDTGAGLSGQTCILEYPPGTAISPPLTTNPDGTYITQINAPSTPGTYEYRTSFAGTLGLGRAVNRILGLGVGLEIPPLTGFVVSLLPAIIALAYALKK